MYISSDRDQFVLITLNLADYLHKLTNKYARLTHNTEMIRQTIYTHKLSNI